MSVFGLVAESWVVFLVIFVIIAAGMASRRKRFFDQRRLGVSVCRNCGANQPGHAAYCRHCGQRLA